MSQWKTCGILNFGCFLANGSFYLIGEGWQFGVISMLNLSAAYLCYTKHREGV